MPRVVAGEAREYWAFISYSHVDATFGRRLHRRLEGYRMPRRLAGRRLANGGVPARLVPIFRDRDELPASGDLSAGVRAALGRSRCLIVVCSPAAAASLWVAREIELFRELHPERPVLAAIREGEPPQCFPAPLRRAGTDGIVVEPLAADFRRAQDGEALALLKLVAGIAGIGLDELVQRDAQRNFRRVTAVTATSLAAVLTMAGLTAYALNARTEAEHQRAEAEGLVEFMLTDLRTKLKGVGRLDVMTAVNERAFAYYGDQNLDHLPDESLGRRARILHAMGEDDETRGDHDAALRKFREARRTTARLLAAAPNDPERIFAQSQSEFWIGYVAYEEHQRDAATKSFRVYSDLVDRAVSLKPDDPIYRHEAAYAAGSLCSVDLDSPQEPQAALQSCEKALHEMETAAMLLGKTPDILEDLINRHAWLADAYLANGRRDDAMTQRLIEEGLLSKQMASDPKNMHLKEMWVALQRALGRLDVANGERPAARKRFESALSTLDEMTSFDPKNTTWTGQKARISAELVHAQ